jgi:hypothetical protein
VIDEEEEVEEPGRGELDAVFDIVGDLLLDWEGGAPVEGEARREAERDLHHQAEESNPDDMYR